MSENMKWWEKTVEYAFIAKAYSDKKFQFAAPLAGRHENAADALIAFENKFVLVEFKRKVDDIDSEQKKFGDAYDQAKNNLKNQDFHHFLVYGSIQGNESNLSLHARRYFLEGSEISAADLFEHGVSKDVFDQYLTLLLKYKKSDGRSSGTITPESMTTVLGIAENGEVMSIALSEYIERYPDIASEPVLESREAPSSGLTMSM